MLSNGTFISECLPDGTVQVENPNVGVYSHVFAVQDEGVSAAVKCTVSSSGAQSNITGCSQVKKNTSGLPRMQNVWKLPFDVGVSAYTELEPKSLNIAYV